jgi:serine-type D-Ala-D-Ala carboxypeptidase
VLRPGTPAEAGMSAARVEHLADLVREWVDAGVAYGIVGLVARHGRIVLHTAHGRLTFEESSPPVRLDSVFRTQSVGKVITATAVMILVEEGRVGLNRPANLYLPELKGEGKDGILIRHLLTHTSGFETETIQKYLDERHGPDARTPAPEGLHPIMHEYLASRWAVPLWKPPGEGMSYCSHNWELLCEIVRRVSGEPLDKFAQRRIFGPLGMRDTSYCRVDLPRERWALQRSAENWETDEERKAMNTERLVGGAGSTVTTAHDLAVFGQMYLNRGAYGDARILSPASIAVMTRNQTPGISAVYRNQRFPESSWGFGWSVHGYKTGWCGGLYSPEAFEHWGAGGAYVWVDPTYDLVGVYLSTAEWGGEDQVYETAMRNDLFTDAATAAIVDP